MIPFSHLESAFSAKVNLRHVHVLLYMEEFLSESELSRCPGTQTMAVLNVDKSWLRLLLHLIVTFDVVLLDCRDLMAACLSEIIDYSSVVDLSSNSALSTTVKSSAWSTLLCSGSLILIFIESIEVWLLQPTFSSS